MITVALAAGLVGALEAVGFVHAFVPVALALTTTALGTLLPILRDHNLLAGPFGRYILAAGAVGELLPIIGIAIFLGAQQSVRRILSLASVGCSPSSSRSRRASRAAPGSSGSWRKASTPRRRPRSGSPSCCSCSCSRSPPSSVSTWCSARSWPAWCCAGGHPATSHALEEKLDAVGYGFFIPVFFVVSGMTLDVHSIVESPLRLLVFFVLLLARPRAAGAVGLSQGARVTQRLQMMFITATALPLLVALAEIGLRNGTMLPENAAALVGAGVLSVIVYPAIAVAIGARRESPSVPRPHPQTHPMSRPRSANPASLPPPTCLGSPPHPRSRHHATSRVLTRPHGDDNSRPPASDTADLGRLHRDGGGTAPSRRPINSAHPSPDSRVNTPRTATARPSQVPDRRGLNGGGRGPDEATAPRQANVLRSCPLTGRPEAGTGCVVR